MEPDPYFHGGDVPAACRRWGGEPSDWVDASASINPWGMPDAFHEALGVARDLVGRYPSATGEGARDAIASQIGCAPGAVAVSNGASEALFLLPTVFGWRSAAVAEPTYVDVRRSLAASGCETALLVAKEEEGFRCERMLEAPLPAGVEVVYLGSPNNPTGYVWEPERIGFLCRKHPQVMFVVDQSFAPFLDPPARWALPGPQTTANLLVVVSLTKFFAIPGLRGGYVWGSPRAVDRFSGRLPPWSLNVIVEAALPAALRDSAFAQKTRERLREARAQLLSGLSRIPGVATQPPTANFILVRLAFGTAAGLQEALAPDRVLVRDASNFTGLTPSHVRIAVRTREENARILEAFGRAVAALRARRSAP